ADVAGVEVYVSGETLADRIAGEREEQVFVVVVAVRHQAVVIEARKIRPDSEAAHRARAPQRKAPFIVTAALGQRIEFQLLFGRARNEIHYTAVSVRSVNRRLRSANNFYVIQKVRGDVSEVNDP